MRKRWLGLICAGACVAGMTGVAAAGAAAKTATSATGGAHATVVAPSVQRGPFWPSAPGFTHVDPLPPARRRATSPPSTRVPAGSGVWATITPPTGFNPGSMLLLTNGSVMIHADNSDQWELLTPDASGSYVNGSWSALPNSPCIGASPCTPYAPQYYGSAVLSDGRVVIQGGEYNGSGTTAETTDGAIYDPATNSWTALTPPSGWTSVGDAPSALLTNGTMMLGDCCNEPTDTAEFNASTSSWTAGPSNGNQNAEEGWTLLPSGNLLGVNVVSSTSTSSVTDLFNATSASWGSGPSTPDPIANTVASEEGPQLLLPGTASMLAVGAGTAGSAGGGAGENSTPGVTDVYDTATGTWSSGPSFPTIGGYGYDVADGPGAVLPDGDALVMASPGTYEMPSQFFDINITSATGAGTMTQVANPAGASTDSSYFGRMIVLPTGQVLWDDGTNIAVYTDSGQPQTAWRPTVTSVPTGLAASGTYTVSGTQLSGLDQGSAYGDDNQDATNYPLVQITNIASGTVTYATTSNFSSYSIAPGTHSSASFALPSGTPTGPSTLEVIANGIASTPVPIGVGVPQCQPLSVSAGAGIGSQEQLSCAQAGTGSLTYTIVTGPSHGTLGAVSAGGVVTYTAQAGFSGTDSFTYKASNADGASAVETVTVQVSAPSCSTVNVSASQGQAANVQLACSDPGAGALTYTVLSQPGHGSLGSVGASGAVSYTPAAGYVGADSFTYRAQAADGVSTAATVNINVVAAPSTTSGSGASSGSTGTSGSTHGGVAGAGTTRVNILRPRSNGERLSFAAGCTSGSVSCVVSVKLTVVERFRRRVRRGHKTVIRTFRRTVTVGTATRTISGSRGSVTVALNGTGRRLLQRLGTLHATLLVWSASGPKSRRGVSFRKARAHKKRHKHGKHGKHHGVHRG